MCVSEIFGHFVHFSVVTNSREYRQKVMNIHKKTMAHRKQIRVQQSIATNPQMDEVAIEPEEEVNLCAACQKESTGKDDYWISCDR